MQGYFKQAAGPFKPAPPASMRPAAPVKPAPPASMRPAGPAIVPGDKQPLQIGQALEQQRTGVRNWLAEIGQKVEQLDAKSLGQLNTDLSRLAQTLHRNVRYNLDKASSVKLAADIFDETSPVESLREPATDQSHPASRTLGPGSHLAQISMSLEKIIEDWKPVEFHAKELDASDRLDRGTEIFLERLTDAHNSTMLVLRKSRELASQSPVSTAALLDSLQKSANLLDQAGTESALQASEGIDAALTDVDASITEAQVVDRLGKVADLLDASGHVEAAALIDTIIKDAVELPKIPSRFESREELYDSAAHNRDTMWENVKSEVAENRKEHHLTTMRGTAPSLSTR